jgi:hypothetical protein
MDNISRSIQFSGGTVTSIAVDSTTGLSYFCINNDRYSFQFGKQLTDSSSPGPNQANHVLVKDSVGACSGSADFAALSSSAVELMGPSMRLSDLDLDNVVGRVYDISVRLAAGDDDLLCSPALANCNSTSTMTTAQFISARDLRCKSITTGGQFCAAAQLQSTVQKRL